MAAEAALAMVPIVQPIVQPHLQVHHGQGRLGLAGGWISGNQEERQEAVRPTYVVKISWL